PPKHAQQLSQRIVELVDDAFLERDDGVVGNRDALRTYVRAALGDVAVADALRRLEVGAAILDIERMHLERRSVDEVSRTNEPLVEPMFAQHMADVLAQEAFDALPEFLDAVDVPLKHPPGAIGRVRRTWPERFDRALYAKVPRHVGDEVFDRRERPH